MNSKDIDFERIKARGRAFWDTPLELTGAACISVVLAGLLPYARRNVETDVSFLQSFGFSGFAVVGFILYLTIAAYVTSFLSRKRASFNVPRQYCDMASFWLTLFSLIKTYVYLQSYSAQSFSFLFLSSTSRTYFSPTIGVLFLLLAPLFLWRARKLEKTRTPDAQSDLDRITTDDEHL
ncbi:hypothetical protein [Brytella acorum]|uniref:Uncharacterized protein n=1 Tax=Brytella acorum TaxID=2959299 RepID=A0AA35Y4J1_9PROT|nr:hypothetical protein [Brytella acorum]MDF3625877.1 hypothetical protein [Brytella acorum]CAI9121877.1 hypothetical protein LMG32879_002733 [Brytella acorum]